MRKAPNLLNRIKVICPTGKSANSCPVPSQKIFRFAIDPTRIYILAILSHSEGRYANVTDVGAGCCGRGGARDGRCQCGRRSRVVLSCSDFLPLGTTQKTSSGEELIWITRRGTE